MKNILILFLAIISLLSCKDDDTIPTQLLKVSNFNIVQSNGIILLNHDCLNPEDNYAVKITVVADEQGEIKPTTIDFSVNNIVSNITFTEPGSKIVPISLIEGENIVQIVSSEMTINAFAIAPATFEIVF